MKSIILAHTILQHNFGGNMQDSKRRTHMWSRTPSSDRVKEEHVFIGDPDAYAEFSKDITREEFAVMLRNYSNANDSNSDLRMYKMIVMLIISSIPLWLVISKITSFYETLYRP